MPSKDIYKSLEKTLKVHARGLGIPDGAAEAFISETIKSVKKTFKDRPLITDQDLKRAVAKELKKFHNDFAYVYEKCDTII